MKNADLEENLVLKHECYICFEICTEASPCMCNTFVHKECLRNYIDSQEKRQCAVCLSDFPTIDSRFPKHLEAIILAVVNIIALLLQWVGSYSVWNTPILISTMIVSILIYGSVKILKYYYNNQCLVYKERIVHK